MKLQKILPGFFLLFFLGYFSFVGIAFSQNTAGSPTLLFQSDDPLSLTLTMDIRTVLKDTGDDMGQHPALISYLTPEGDTIIVPLRIRTRGYFRRDPMNCNFPPLRLNFAKETSGNTIFEGQDKLKLVTHCRSSGKQYEQNVLKEYLAYRFYNLFTEESYRVRLAEMNYADSEGKIKTLRKLAFIIEPEEQMAARNLCDEVKIKNIRQDYCDQEKATLLSVFQYMIGNTDWSVPAMHNIDLIRKQAGGSPIPVPFDFDWSGLVNAPYAVPSKNLNIDNVRIRVYRGLCRTEEEFEKAFQEFRDREEEIIRTIESVPYLDEREMSKTIRYIEQFFNVINNPNAVRKEIYNACRTD